MRVTSAETTLSQIEGANLESTEFGLVKYFSLTCLGLFLFVTTVMCFGFYAISKIYIRQDAELRAIQYTEHLVPLAFETAGGIPEFGTPAYEALDSKLRATLHALSIVKIKIYDTGMRIVYTTDPTIRIGTLDPDNKSLLRVLTTGNVVSSLQTGKHVWDLEGEQRPIGTIVETYLPVNVPSRAVGPAGVFEIYQDVSSTYGRLPSLILIIAGASIVAMGILYAFLLLIVSKAETIIRRQTQTIRVAKSRLEQHARELEDRVEERTRQLRETLAQQIQDQKMVATGTLAAGIAHELNTPLGAILGSVQMIADHKHAPNLHAVPGAKLIESCPQCGSDLDRVRSQARRCKEIIAGLVGFARKSDSQRAPENLMELIRHSVMLTEPQARQYAVDVSVSCQDELPPLIVNGNEILQVLVNVLNNAVTAMPEGGPIDIDVRRIDRVARVSVRDHGIGMTPEIVERVFEPFFTTKDVGKGTGLGLSISYRIVRDHGGTIAASSVLGEGSEFVIQLPLGTEGDVNGDLEEDHG